MANLTASDPTPTVTWDDTSLGGIDWRMISGSGPMQLDVFSGGYTTVFEWTSTLNKSLRDVTIETSEPILTLSDSTSSNDDFRLRANGGEMFVEENSSGGTWNSMLKLAPSLNTSTNDFTIETSEPILTLSDSTSTNDDIRIRAQAGRFFIEENSSGGSWSALVSSNNGDIYVRDALASGSSTAKDALQWTAWTGALTTGAGGVTEVNVTLGTGRKIVGASVMITDATGDDVDADYKLYDYLDAANASEEFQVIIRRGNGGGPTQDFIRIVHDTSYDGGRYKIVAFYAPNI